MRRRNSGAARPLRRRAALFAGACLALAGCAQVPPDAGFTQVQQAIADRLGTSVSWNRGTAKDQAVAERIRALLAKPLTADAAAEIALINSPQLQAAFEEIGIAQGDLVQAGLLANPSLELSALAATPQTAYSGTVVEDFLNVFTRAARMQIAGKDLERTSFLVANKVIDYAAEVRAAYYTVVADQQTLALFRQVTDASQAAAELAERQRRAGNISSRDQALQQSLYATTLLQQAQRESELAADRELLNRLLGLWRPEATWMVPDRLPDLPANLLSEAELERQAVANRLDLAAARTDVELAADSLGFLRDYRFLQEFGLGFEFDRDADNAHKRGPALRLSLPIFDQRQGQSRALEAELRQKERMLEALAIELRTRVRAAYLRVRTAQASARYYRQTLLPLNEQIVSESQRLYNGMLLGIYDLLLTRQGQINASREYVNALRDFWLARSELERLVGGRVSTSAITSGPAGHEPLPNPETKGASP